MARRKVHNDTQAIRGFARVQLVEHDEHGMSRVVGDSGWRKNQIVEEGRLQYLCRTLGAQANSRQIARMMLGTGGAPATNATALPGELDTATYSRTTVSVSQIASSAVEFQATFASANSHITASVALSNVGLIYDTTSAGTLFAGVAFTSSQWNTNQSVEASYRINFATA